MVEHPPRSSEGNSAGVDGRETADFAADIPDRRAGARTSALYLQYMEAVAAAVSDYVEAKRPTRLSSTAVGPNEIQVCFQLSQAAAFQAMLNRRTEGLFPSEQ